MLDVYLHGSASRISPEAPVPVVLSERVEKIPGGAGNVAHNLRALGCQVSLLGCVGRDYKGEFLLRSLSEMKINIDGIKIVDSPTTCKTRVLSNGQHVVRYDVDPVPELVNIPCENVTYQNFDCIVISDYNKGSVTNELMKTVKQTFSCPIICDIKPNNKYMFNDVFCITPNLNEAKQMVGDVGSPESVGKKLLSEMNLESIILTLSNEGILFLNKVGNVTKLKAHTQANKQDPKSRLDVTGAGDTVISTFAACVAAGFSLTDATFICNVAAGVVVKKIGTSVCSLEELTVELNDLEGPAS